MNVKLEPGQLDDLDEEVANMKKVLEECVDTDSLISAAQSMMEELDQFLEGVSHDTKWERQHNPDQLEEDSDDES